MFTDISVSYADTNSKHKLQETSKETSLTTWCVQDSMQKNRTQLTMQQNKARDETTKTEGSDQETLSSNIIK